MKKRNGSTYRWRKLREQILQRDEYRCAYCGDAATQVDHVTSLDKGGTDEPDNLVASCSTCNLRKNNKDAREFTKQIRDEKILKQIGFFESGKTPPTPSLSFSPENIRSPFERP